MQIKKAGKVYSLVIVVITLTSLYACGARTAQSDLLVSDVAHTPVKRQSIGNCWLYATSSWAESLHLSATGQELNLSESYWTYWDWHYKLINSSVTKINTAGGWFDASRIIRKHGYMLEEDFIASEAESEMSRTQKAAEAAVNFALTEGALKNPQDRTESRVSAVLDRAFGVSMSDLEDKIHKAAELATSPQGARLKLSLADQIAGGSAAWKVLSYPQLFGSNAIISRRVKRQRDNVLRRVFRAVNKKQPVIMSTMVEFSALNTTETATFEYDLYLSRGYSTGQGGHLLVLEDYTVDNVPGVGSIGEGDVSLELKQAAVLGDLKYFVAKNSWGTNRPDRGLSDGYTRFTADYLNRPLPFGLDDDESDISQGSWYSALNQFILPPGF